jgi:hypothetical protein
MSSLSELFLVLAPLLSGGLVTSYHYPIDWEGGNPVSTLTITNEWGQSLGAPEEEDTLSFSVASAPDGTPLVVLQALHSNWELVLEPEEIPWEELEVARDHFWTYQQTYDF